MGSEQSHSGQEAFLMGWTKRMGERKPPVVWAEGNTLPLRATGFAHCTTKEGAQFRREEETLDHH